MIEPFEPYSDQNSVNILSEFNSIKKDLSALIDSIKSSNNDKIKEANKKLNAQSESFAAKRMDRSIQKTLTGKSINKLEF